MSKYKEIVFNNLFLVSGIFFLSADKNKQITLGSEWQQISARIEKQKYDKFFDRKLTICEPNLKF